MRECACMPTEFPFYCERHQVRKSAHWVELCQTRDSFWQAWEEGHGPGQFRNGQTQTKRRDRKVKKGDCGGCGGKLAAMAWDLTKSIAAFIADGLKTVDEEEYRRRLSVCDVCEKRRGQRCGSCGCFIALKAKGRAWDCPDGRWKQEEK